MLITRRLTFPISRTNIRPLTTTASLQTPAPPINQEQLLRVCTILYQQQHSPTSRLFSSLSSLNVTLTHDFFLHVCNCFPLSWRPVYLFYLYTTSQPPTTNTLFFHHTPVTFNKMLDVIGRSRNMDLFWEMALETGKRKLANDKTFRVVLKTLASARELKKCVSFFHLMNGFGYGYNVVTLSRVVETLCKGKLVEEARVLVTKMKEWIRPDKVTYRLLVLGYCDVGDLIEASKVWNLMVDEGFEMDIEAGEKIMETLFKKNSYDEAVRVFKMMNCKNGVELGVSVYRVVIDWMCKRGRIEEAYQAFDDMRQRGLQPDNLTLAAIIYGLLVRRRVAEAYKIVEGIENPDISIYHGLIKGLLKLKRAVEATEVFREMVRRGCEPIMHTYVMLLQGHLGKRGRKGPDPLVNFDTIFVGGLVKAGKRLEATKYVERTMKRGLEVPRFDYNKFLHYYSTDEGVVMFEEVGKKLREVGLFDLADILQRYGEKMATRERRRERTIRSC